MFRFSSLNKEEIEGRLNLVASKENLSLRPDGLDALLYVCEGTSVGQ